MALCLLVLSFDADARRRGLRIEFEDFGWSQAFLLGSSECPGSTPGSSSVFWNGIEFGGGSASGTYNTDEYCQQGIAYDPLNPDDPFLSADQFFDPDDDGIKLKIGANDNAEPSANVQARIYSFMDRNRFDEGVQGFQWEFFLFPGGLSLVRLNGTVPIPGGSDFAPFISGDTEIWSGFSYDGDFWCFDGADFVGTWDGAPAGTSPLAGCQVDTSCHWLDVVVEGNGDVPLASPQSSPGCPVGEFREGEVITLTARPAPGWKVGGWASTDDDSSLALVNQVTFIPFSEEEGTLVWLYYQEVLWCPPGESVAEWLAEDMEGSADGWSDSTVTGTDWALQQTEFVSPTNAWSAWSDGGPGDQRLVSPPVFIPAAASTAVLSFYNQRDFENEYNCYCGAILEYSTDGGTQWSWAAYSDFLSDNPDGFTQWDTGHPNDPFQDGWCSQQPWTLTELDVSPLAGETVKFRFRLGNDGIGAHTGRWSIDDVTVSGCIPDLLHRDGFEE